MAHMFTIITVCFNSENMIERTIRSLLDQDFNDYEYIIKDGNSSDNTQDIINSLISESDSVHIISSNDKGIYDAMNIAIASATGEYIYFLNAGDQFTDRSVLTDMDRELKVFPSDIIYGNVRFIGNDRIVLRKYGKICSNKIYYLIGDSICHQAIFAKRELLQERAFDLSYKVCADREWLLYCIKMKFSFKSVMCVVSDVLVEGYSTSHIDEFEAETKKCINQYCRESSWLYCIISGLKKSKLMLNFFRLVEKLLFCSKTR